MAVRVIAIDGPAGAGKSTVAKLLALRLGLEYLQTGAMYRAVALGAMSRGIDPADADQVARLARGVDVEVVGTVVLVDGVDVSAELRGDDVSRLVSVVAAHPAVREELVRRQREWAIERNGGVLEGRDIGTVVFPDAVLKVYLTARPEVRVARRSSRGDGGYHRSVADALAQRDAEDQGRKASPLAKAQDAVEIDTSDLTPDEIVTAILELLEATDRERGA